jgi:hypothetical protein
LNNTNNNKINNEKFLNLNGKNQIEINTISQRSTKKKAAGLKINKNNGPNTAPTRKPNNCYKV